jgi:hypothetical protein
LKSLAAAEADFQGREGNMVVDFWTTDVSGLYAMDKESFQLRWERRDAREPDVRGEETLTLSLPAGSAGRTFTLPSPEVDVTYAMATPSKGQGARAVDIQGVVSVVGNGRVWLDLKARMERLDAPGVEFDEAVRGLFTLPEKS